MELKIQTCWRPTKRNWEMKNISVLFYLSWWFSINVKMASERSSCKELWLFSNLLSSVVFSREARKTTTSSNHRIDGSMNQLLQQQAEIRWCQQQLQDCVWLATSQYTWWVRSTFSSQSPLSPKPAMINLSNVNNFYSEKVLGMLGMEPEAAESGSKNANRCTMLHCYNRMGCASFFHLTRI